MSPAISPMQKLVADLRAELAQSQAREAALVEAALRLLLNIPDGELDIAVEVWGQTNVSVVMQTKRQLEVALADISPAAKALLERAEKGDRAIEALRAIVIESDGDVYYRTSHDVPMEIPERHARKIRAALTELEGTE